MLVVIIVAVNFWLCIILLGYIDELMNELILILGTRYGDLLLTQPYFHTYNQFIHMVMFAKWYVCFIAS